MENEVNMRYGRRRSTQSSASAPDDDDVTTQTLPRMSPQSLKKWRPSSLVNLVPRRPRILSRSSSMDIFRSNEISNPDISTNPDIADKEKEVLAKKSTKKILDTVVAIVVVGARGLPYPPGDGSSNHTIFCRIRLGSYTVKTKAVRSSHQPIWRERVKFRLDKEQMARVSLWDRGKHKHFMGRCVIDLSQLERDRTHEIWTDLDEGFGAIHLIVTIYTVGCTSTKLKPIVEQNLEEIKHRFTFCNLEDWRVVGQMVVKVISAKGLYGKPNAYCKLEVDNEKVQTPSVKFTSEPEWNKTFMFNVYDITSTLDLEVCDNSLMNYLSIETLGGVSIPLLRVTNGKKRWYALKDRSKRNIARGNCPRILLEITVFWNPVKAACRLFQPKEVVYIKKTPKFHVGLLYSNLVFLKDTFQFLQEINEQFKLLFEWDNRELSTLALVVWLVFWYHFRPWAAPLLLLPPFLYFWVTRKGQESRPILRSYVNDSSTVDTAQCEETKNGTTLTEKIQGVPELTIVITSAVEFIVSLIERLYNLVSFKVPFLSYLSMLLLVGASVIFYIIPFNYLVMGFGLYKYTRKYLNPGRILNNDILDFISRVPDNEILKDWNEIKVPEPINHNNSTDTVEKTNVSLKSD